MDTAQVMIGHDVGGRKAKAAASAEKSAQAQRRREAYREKVDVLVNDTLVREMEMGVLIRFSKVASDRFTQNIKEQAVVKDRKDEQNGSWADDKDGKIDVKELTKQVKNLPKTSSSGKGMRKGVPQAIGNKATLSHSVNKQSSEPAQANGKAIQAAEESKQQKKSLNLAHGDGTIEPTPQAVNTLLELMLANANVYSNKPLLDLDVPGNASDIALLDVYSAAIVLGLRPFPRHLERIMKNIVSNQAPGAAMIGVWLTRLPKSQVLTRLLTSVAQHHEEDAYKSDEFKNIRAVIAADRYINTRFTGILKSRKAESLASQHQRRMASNWSKVEAEDKEQQGDVYSLKELGNVLDKTQAPASPKQTIAQKVLKSGPTPKKSDEAKKATKQGNAKGVGGRHVPGA
ncbi:hypothetical protein KC340_g4621 [Hortaea werneckii]|nr:hypothetical protein KC342_g6207 [Hortaea werneckii]KAI7101456.1 hypothetical protein KC339_g6739 [Hortaea werneckii]KAI7243177.1 hypothetical protein KC365_g2518 [Hortaea werneckii]KAI7329521.1 hypothetical protein KC340_g4621 [Hortaea werneckii]KAI7386108.1 hypothetical protein KC328_g10017 [Hortaea werneckii]